MRKLATVVIVLAIAVTASAQNQTQSVLEARPVKNFIRVKLVDNFDANTVAAKPKILKYAIDSFNPLDFKPIQGTSFRVETPVLLLLADHNPVLEAYGVKRTRTPDPNYEALKAFMEELKTLQAALPPAPSLAGGGGPANETPDQRRLRIAATCNQNSACIAATEDNEACALFAKLIEDALIALNKKELDPATFAQFVNDASGYDGVDDLRKHLAQVRTNITNNNKEARDAFKEIRQTFGADPGKQPTRVCSKISSIILINYSDLLARAEGVIARKEAFSAEIGKFHKSLDPYSIEQKWVGLTDRTDYIATSLNPTAEEQENVTISLKLQEISADAANTTITTAVVKNSEVEAAFPIRIDSFFTIERALAAVYNTLEYPQYGTETTGGQTVVKKKDDHQPIDAAVMFNFLPRLGSISGAYPMFQIGFSSAKDFPGLLAGVGVRLVGRFPLSMSVGGMITRYKDLDGTLKEGDPVTGTAQINEHLVYKTSPVALYGAIQVKF